MEGILTPQEAKEVDLSLNPIKRHKQVESHLASIANSTGLEILINPDIMQVEADNARTLAMYTISPLLGRRALVRTAKAVEIFESHGYGKGMEN